MQLLHLAIMPLTQERTHPTHKPVATYVAAGLLLISLAGGGLWVASQVAMVPSSVPPSMAVAEHGDRNGLSANAHSQLRLSSAGPNWREISSAQRQILMPLHERWDSMGALTKRRWLVLADRYPSMDEVERTKLVSRMHTWAGLSAQQRNQARINFESAKRLSPKDLQSKWDEYQALSEAEKKRLAEQARKTKAAAAKKSKRRLARMPAQKIEAAPKTAPDNATPPASSDSPAIATGQVFTPKALPHVHLPPLSHGQGVQPSTEPTRVAPSSVSSQPVAMPQATPMVELPPLPVAPAPMAEPTATQPLHDHAQPQLSPH